jgi:hypothetical protein
MSQILTSSGGLLETLLSTDRFSGTQLYLHIDQSTNLNNGEGDAAIILNMKEVKDLIFLLNDFITFMEGKPHVVLAEPLLHPDVKIVVDDKEVPKVPELVNPYLAVEDFVSPGESNIDYDHYFESVSTDLPKPEDLPNNNTK